MRPRVEQLWVQFNEDLEGIFDFFYVDKRGLVTTGMGNLCEPLHLALRFEWQIDGRRATIEEVTRDWHAINSRERELSNVFAPGQAKYTQVRLAPGAIDAMVRRQLHLNIEYLKHFLPEWDSWPSDAQLAVASVAWGRGAGLDRTSPSLVRAANRRDWLDAKQHARFNATGNESLRRRNAKQDRCFDNAAIVERRALDPAPLYWPGATPAEDDLEKVATAALELSLRRDGDPDR